MAFLHSLSCCWLAANWSSETDWALSLSTHRPAWLVHMADRECSKTKTKCEQTLAFQARTISSATSFWLKQHKANPDIKDGDIESTFNRRSTKICGHFCYIPHKPRWGFGLQSPWSYREEYFYPYFIDGKNWDSKILSNLLRVTWLVSMKLCMSESKINDFLPDLEVTLGVLSLWDIESVAHSYG